MKSWRKKKTDFKYINVFKSVIMIVFQNIFHLEKYFNNIFYFLKIIFKINTSK